MMKKMICMLMVLMMMAASSAMAMTFDEGVAFMLDMVRESMETQGRTYWFTECKPCYGMGEVLVSIKCKTCGGDGRK